MYEADGSPTMEESALAVVKAVASRRARHRANPANAQMTVSAIAERVTGMAVPPRAGRDQWWLVGRVLDDIDDAEYSVWFVPGSRRIGLSKRERPPLTPIHRTAPHIAPTGSGASGPMA